MTTIGQPSSIEKWRAGVGGSDEYFGLSHVLLLRLLVIYIRHRNLDVVDVSIEFCCKSQRPSSRAIKDYNLLDSLAELPPQYHTSPKYLLKGASNF